MKKTILILGLLITIALIAGCTQKVPSSPQGTPQQNTNNQGTSPAEQETPPATVPSTVTFLEPLPNIGNAVISGAENSITIKFKNNIDSPITLMLTGDAAKYSKSECKTPTVTAVYLGKQVEARVTQIKTGDTFIVTWDCHDLANIPAPGTGFSADLRFEYMPESTGLIRSQVGTVIGTYE